MPRVDNRRSELIGTCVCRHSAVTFILYFQYKQSQCTFVSLFINYLLFFPRLQRVLSHQDDTALLKAYIVEWRKFFTQCDILPKPFCQLEITLMGKQGSNKKSNVEDSIVRKVSDRCSRVLLHALFCLG